MLLPFKLGVGGPVGTGKQWMSWISLDDLVYLLYFFICEPRAHGAFNATAPQPMRNADFGRCLGKALFRPAFAPLPGFMVRLMFGEMGERLLLEGAKVMPRKAEELGYTFIHRELSSYFSEML